MTNSNNYSNNMAVSMIVAFASLTAIASADANIVKTSYWNEHDLPAVSGVEIENGIALSDDPVLNNMLVEAKSRPGHPDDLSGPENVQRVERVFSEAKYDEWTTGRNAIYTYNNFLRAVAKYPAFCGLSNSPRGLSADDTCKREIAALFAHMKVMSDDFSLAAASGCSGDTTYCGRGPLMI